MQIRHAMSMTEQEELKALEAALNKAAFLEETARRLASASPPPSPPPPVNILSTPALLLTNSVSQRPLFEIGGALIVSVAIIMAVACRRRR